MHVNGILKSSSQSEIMFGNVWIESLHGIMTEALKALAAFLFPGQVAMPLRMQEKNHSTYIPRLDRGIREPQEHCKFAISRG